jgi:hypothetical protein
MPECITTSESRSGIESSSTKERKIGLSGLLSLLQPYPHGSGLAGRLGGIVSLLGLLLHVLASPFKSQARLEAETVFLRHH